MRIVSLGDYRAKVVGTSTDTERNKKSLELLYKENKVIEVINAKGETYFVVEKK